MCVVNSQRIFHSHKMLVLKISGIQRYLINICHISFGQEIILLFNRQIYQPRFICIIGRRATIDSTVTFQLIKIQKLELINHSLEGVYTK